MFLQRKGARLGNQWAWSFRGWSQGGESEWNSAAPDADETKASIYQDIEVPKAGDFSFLCSLC